MPSPPSDSMPRTSQGATLFVVATVQFLVPFLMSSVGVALPVIGRELEASVVQLSLAQTFQVLALVVLLLPMGRFADIHGRKRIYTIGIVVVCLSTLALALARSIEFFLVQRFIQGLGAAMIFSTSMAILTAVFPPARRGRAMGITVSSVYVGLALGPSLSGIVVNHLGWRWVFVIIFAIGLIALIITLTRLEGEWATAKGEPFDWVGAFVFMVSVLLLVYGSIQLTKVDLAKWVALIGLAGLAGFATLEWRSAYPLLDLRMLRENLPFTFSNLATFINYASTASFMFFFSLYLQYVKGFSPQSAGLLLVVQPAVQALLAPLAGRLADSYPPARIATLGMAFCTVGLFFAATIGADTSFTLIVAVMVMLGMSLGLFSTPNMSAIMGSVGPQHLGTAASMVSTMRTTGMLFSATAIAVVLSVYLGDQAVDHGNVPLFVKSMQTSLYLFAAMSLVGTFFSMVKGRLAESITARRG